MLYLAETKMDEIEEDGKVLNFVSSGAMVPQKYIAIDWAYSRPPFFLAEHPLYLKIISLLCECQVIANWLWQMDGVH